LVAGSIAALICDTGALLDYFLRNERQAMESFMRDLAPARSSSRR
jgi:hypothetical protein